MVNVCDKCGVNIRSGISYFSYSCCDCKICDSCAEYYEPLIFPQISDDYGTKRLSKQFFAIVLQNLVARQSVTCPKCSCTFDYDEVYNDNMFFNRSYSLDTFEILHDNMLREIECEFRNCNNQLSLSNIKLIIYLLCPYGNNGYVIDNDVEYIYNDNDISCGYKILRFFRNIRMKRFVEKWKYVMEEIRYYPKYGIEYLKACHNFENCLV